MKKIYLSTVCDCLIQHRIIQSPEELTANSFADLVASFQERNNLLIDGILGKDTLWRLQYPILTNQSDLHWIKCEADTVEGIECFDHFWLRSDAAKQFNALREEVESKGGIITSSGGKRNLDEGASSHRSAKSMHYAGLAFDLAILSGFFRPEEDAYVIVKNKEKSKPYWLVFARADEGQSMELEATYWKDWNSGKDLKKTVRGKFINFTSLCQKHGFEPISPRRAYLRKENKKYLSSEWWHFQANSLLIPNFSQFGIELLKIEGYDEQLLSSHPNIWENRKVIFGENWY